VALDGPADRDTAVVPDHLTALVLAGSAPGGARRAGAALARRKRPTVLSGHSRR
jgi:hypothetical protein